MYYILYITKTQITCNLFHGIFWLFNYNTKKVYAGYNAWYNELYVLTIFDFLRFPFIHTVWYLFCLSCYYWLQINHGKIIKKIRIGRVIFFSQEGESVFFSNIFHIYSVCMFWLIHYHNYSFIICTYIMQNVRLHIMRSCIYGKNLSSVYSIISSKWTFSVTSVFAQSRADRPV